MLLTFCFTYLSFMWFQLLIKNRPVWKIFKLLNLLRHILVRVNQKFVRFWSNFIRKIILWDLAHYRPRWYGDTSTLRQDMDLFRLRRVWDTSIQRRDLDLIRLIRNGHQFILRLIRAPFILRRSWALFTIGRYRTNLILKNSGILLS